MKKGTEQAKRKHHTVPRSHLRRFCEAEGSPFIWRYEKGTRQALRDNVSVFSVGRNYYALPRPDGTLDSNSFENFLERQVEEPAQSVFRKLLVQQPIISGERDILAKYLAYQLKRVPKHKERINKLLPGVLDDLQSGLLLGLDRLAIEDPSVTPIVEQRKREAVAIVDEYRGWKDVPNRFYLTVINERLAEVFSAMRWQILIAPEGTFFATSDNPLCFFESMGLGHELAEVTFPFSSTLALWASWQKGPSMSYILTNPQVVAEINGRTVASALRYVYYHEKAEWLIDLVNTEIDAVSLLVSDAGEAPGE